MSETIFKEYDWLKTSAVGKHLEEWMKAEHDTLISKAGKSNDPQEAFGYLKTACGIMLVLEHINLMAKGE
jgi:hypothetical protein